MPDPGDAITAPDPSEYLGGDPVMSASGTGHDYAETLALSQDLDVATKAKGAPLTVDEVDAIAKLHPSADSLPVLQEARDRTARAVWEDVKGAVAGLGTFGKWLVVGAVAIAVVLVLVELRSVKGAVLG